MKTKVITTLAVLAFSISVNAEDKAPHTHDQTKVGPTGGRLITKVEPHAEFLVNSARKIEIRFVDDANKVLVPGKQVVNITMGDRSAPTKLSFSVDGDKLVSDGTIPEGNDHPTVVQIRADEGAKAVTAKFNLNLATCPECSHPEYACTCDHAHD
ncbi:MAG: hypothetical protein KDK97_17800 [Verrucomicrobiales bacterium]|nr:hypothetical protein [Verrucomicrobiales bacterium]MCP5558080.1 hypothetical protein [Verrucomicrobiaceae bacterium]